MEYPDFVNIEGNEYVLSTASGILAALYFAAQLGLVKQCCGGLGR